MFGYVRVFRQQTQQQNLALRKAVFELFFERCVIDLLYQHLLLICDFLVNKFNIFIELFFSHLCCLIVELQLTEICKR